MMLGEFGGDRWRSFKFVADTKGNFLFKMNHQWLWSLHCEAFGPSRKVEKYSPFTMLAPSWDQRSIKFFAMFISKRDLDVFFFVWWFLPLWDVILSFVGWGWVDQLQTWRFFPPYFSGWITCQLLFKGPVKFSDRDLIEIIISLISSLCVLINSTRGSLGPHHRRRGRWPHERLLQSLSSGCTDEDNVEMKDGEQRMSAFKLALSWRCQSPCLTIKNVLVVGNINDGRDFLTDF